MRATRVQQRVTIYDINKQITITSTSIINLNPRSIHQQCIRTRTMATIMSLPNRESEIREFISERQLEWLQERGLSFADLLEDEDGEYILSESDTGHPSDEGYSAGFTRIDLPDFTEELTQ